ncbi:protein-tyrosine phosphatase-like protein [Chytridium lagenaria]|nr:protein-tyrosine phosphatase-like protein [Chytridium lagenaria]
MGTSTGPQKLWRRVFGIEDHLERRDFCLTSSINASNVPKDVLFLRGGIQGLFSKFQSLCFGTDGRPLVPGGVMRRGSSSEILSESDGDSEQEKPWIYSDILMGLNDSVSDPLVIELLRKRMAIQMAVMSMITSPIPADDPPRLVLYHVSEIAYASIGGGGLKKDDTKVVGLSPHPFLYIGSQESAKPKHLKSHAITHVIRLGNCRWPYQSCAGVSFHDLPIDDVPTARISSLFPTTTALLDGIRIRGERVLVHCQAGVSRSASIVLSFILRRGVKGAAGGLPNTKSRTMQQPAVPSSEQGLPSFSQASNSLVSASTTLREAFQILHSARPIVCPNPGFWSELEQYERVLCMAASSGLPGGSAFGNPAAMQTQSSSLSYFWMIQFHTVLDIEYRARAAVQRQSKAIQHG